MIGPASPASLLSQGHRGQAQRLQAQREQAQREQVQRGQVLVNLLLVTTLAGAGGFWWWSGIDRGPQPIDALRVVSVEKKDIMRAVLATGRVEPEARVNVMSRASGILKVLYADVGDRVTKGQILAELDREQLEAQLAENLGNQAAAEARLLASKARLAEAKVKLRDPELDYAKSELRRTEDLVKDGGASRTELDERALRVKAVEYRILQTEASIPVIEAQIAQSVAEVSSADASLERIETSLREATIRSPIDGVVLVRDKDVGDGISSILTAGGNATAVMTLGDASSMYVEAMVDEVDVGRIFEGQKVVITVDAYRDRTFLGEVLRIAPGGTVDNNGLVTFEVKISVTDPERLLRVDMTANTKLVLEEKAGIPVLPHKTLTSRGNNVWVVTRVTSLDPPVTEEVEVEIGLSDGLLTEVVAGLAVGDRVLLPSPPTSSRGR